MESNRRTIALGLAAAGLAAPAFARPAFAQVDLAAPPERREEAPPPAQGAYTEEEIINSTSRFFGMGAETVAAVVRRIFRDLGRPVGFVEGSEGSAAIGVGLRYGEGRLYLNRAPQTTKVFWRGPSVGFDTGANAAKCFTLVYGVTHASELFQRFPGVEGSAYFIGGIGVNYQRADEITLAPMRAGVGFRLGANIGYLAYSRQRRFLPF
ncbi:MAG: DUF1134 domain-containing protein [Hyphomonadaceae bacterium]|nr:DUF1134 domain-containing protein [Hyphomonadaceae bacterium]